MGDVHFFSSSLAAGMPPLPGSPPSCRPTRQDDRRVTITEKPVFALPGGDDVKAWRYPAAGAELPEWISTRVESRQPNGTFLIGSKVGLVRVHVGHVVLEHGRYLYTCEPDEAGLLVQELREEAAQAPPPVGPGKKVDRCGAAPLKRPSGRREEAATSGPKEATAKTFGKPVGVPPSVENAITDALQIDDSYQRSIDTEPSRRLITAIANGWDWRMCMPLVVSRRPDGYFVIDGQHRLAAAKLRGDIPFLPCCVANYASVADEAAMFVAMNRARRQINRLDDFHAAIASGDEDALDIKRLVEAAGLRVARKTGSTSWVPGEVPFTAAVSKVLQKHGEKTVAEALQAISEAFPDEVLSNGASVFLALTRLMVTPPDEDFDRDRLFRALLKYDMKGWGSFLTGTKGGDDRASALRQALLMAYAETPAEAGSEV